VGGENLENLANFFVRQVPEQPELDDLALPGIEREEVFQRVVQRDEIEVSLVGKGDGFIPGKFVPTAAAFSCALSPRVVDQNPLVNFMASRRNLEDCWPLFALASALIRLEASIVKRPLLPNYPHHMKQYPLFLVLVAGMATSSLGQQPKGGLPVGPAGEMAAPNYSTKGLTSRPSLVPPSPAAPAAITYNITFTDPSGPYSSYYPTIAAAIQAAGAEWNKHLVGSGSLEVEVLMANIPTMDGTSVTTGFVRNDGTRDIFEQGAAYEIRTGTDPNGADPDIRIRIGTAYLTNELWFDPNPQLRTAPIPANHIDALSVLIHELGHAFVFNGWMNATNGQLPAAYMSTFDANASFDGNNLYFNGAGATARYGRAVPLTYANYGHLGNNAPRPGSELLPDLMNGVVYYYQARYFISPLDLEIARDSGIAINPLADQLLNIATRLRVQTGDNALIGGFIVTGSAPKKVIVRAVGPSLTNLGIAGALADPALELHGPEGFATITNDNWRDTQQAEIQATGLAPGNNLESAIVATLAPGAYTAIVRGQGDGTGVGLVEAYDLQTWADSRLANISTRGRVEGGENVMIGGLIAGPANGATGQMLVRAIGPSLSNLGVPGALPDPFLELHDSSGALVASNNDWKDTQRTQIEATGIPPSNDKESAILSNLAPGSYTAIVSGVGNTSGVGLVEVYKLQ
jgi:hypothetical protein